MAAKQLKAGDRVAHSARVAYQHGSQSIARWDSLKGLDAEAFAGTVVQAANDAVPGTVWTVEVDKGDQNGPWAGTTRDFTADSLVKIEE